MDDFPVEAAVILGGQLLQSSVNLQRQSKRDLNVALAHTIIIPS